MIQLANPGAIDAFRAALKLEMARLDREISAAYYQWTARIFRELVEGTPQWSGDVASNWNYSIGQPDFSYVPSPNKVGADSRVDYKALSHNPFGVMSRGMDPAVSDALSAMSISKQPTWRDQVYIANGAPIANDLENGLIKVRPVNLIGGAVLTIYSIAAIESQKATP